MGAEDSQEQGGILFPCNATLPDLDLDIGGVYMARIKAQDLNLGFIGNGQCFGGLQVTGGDGLGIYGDIFFKSQFVAFNGGNNSLGMALHA
ncbi:hypothetical protein NQ176_g5352 [Zarea fungicola]|uniref:Uncharacterized protein n=1 Tax=Zarea fungicola TaxID=93591 RepID=A0ACC1NA65_9HYPO|nr:hypothetical protein NQ176_g5352 [Lecanicillium fungicola]